MHGGFLHVCERHCYAAAVAAEDEEEEEREEEGGGSRKKAWAERLLEVLQETPPRWMCTKMSSPGSPCR